MREKKRVGIYGWGLVAPRSRNVDTFEKNLEIAGSWLKPFDGFGPSNFLVGEPDFDFEEYRSWFDSRFPPSRFGQLKEKMGPTAQYALAGFIQALSQNQGLEMFLQELGAKCHIYVGTGLGEVTVQHAESVKYERALRRWNEFWGGPERCSARRKHELDQSNHDAPPLPDAEQIGSESWIDAKHVYEQYWCTRSEDLTQYLREAATIQGEPVPPSSGTAKLGSIRQKLSGIKALNKRWGCPEEPWTSVSANYLWNIANVPASQISMAGKIMGPAFAPIAACASFGISLKMAYDAIQLGEASAVVIGMVDPPPHGVVISAFYNANVLSADAAVSRPLTALKGTHVSGGSCVWIVGDAEVMSAQGFKPLGLEIVAVGTSSDAHHIITPSKAGPQLAMQQALDGLDVKDFTNWDMHATATPGDTTEIAHSLEMLHQEVLFTARKGTFGHGMSVGGGWELTAQHLGLSKGKLFPTSLEEGDLHADVAIHSARFVKSAGETATAGLSGKLSMGIGGINACVVSRAWDDQSHEESEP